MKILKVFYRFEAKKKGWFFLFLAMVFVGSILYSSLPFFYKLFVDNLPMLNYWTLLRILLAYFGVRMLSLIFNSLSFVVGDYVSFEAGIEARRTIFKRIQDLDFVFHSQKSTGSLISAMKRGDSAFFSIHHAIHHRIIEILVGFLVMVYFFSFLDTRIVLLVLLSFLINLIVTKFVVGYNVSTRAKFNDEEDKISGIIVDNIINFETVKLFSKEVWEQNRLKDAFDPWRKYLWKYANSFRLLDISVGSLVNLSIFSILLFGLNLSVYGKMSLGDFVLILGFVESFFPRLFDLVFGFRDIAKNFADIEKYFGILDIEVKIKDPENPIYLSEVKGEIRFKNVNFTYEEGRKNAVRNINLKIRQGQSIAFVGRSGSGKTTLIKLLMRFYDVDRGKITIDSVDVSKLTKSHLRSFVGVVPQEPILFNNTIGYNIGYGKEQATKEEIVAAARIANLDRFIESLPKRYKTHVGERGVKLSGGQKQRLAIARMILSDPEIIIFDEATSQLDSENEKLIQSALWKAAKDKTTIIIAHRLSTASHADKIVVMDHGKIVEEGSHKALLSKESLYKHFWDLQVNSN